MPNEIELDIRIFYSTVGGMTKISTTFEATTPPNKELLVGIIERAKLQILGLDGDKIENAL